MEFTAPKPALNCIQSQSIEIIASTVSWPILNCMWKPIQSCFPDMWRDSSLAGADRNERRDKEVQTQPPTARRQKGRRVTDHKINRLLLFFFLTYRGTAQTQLLARDSRQGNHHERQSTGGRQVGGVKGGVKIKKVQDGKMSLWRTFLTFYSGRSKANAGLFYLTIQMKHLKHTWVRPATRKPLYVPKQTQAAMGSRTDTVHRQMWT